MEEKKKKVIDISLADIIKIVRADFRKVCIYSCTAGVIGVILAFATPKIYKSTVILAPEESGSSFSGSLSSLASMVGMNMKIGQTGDALYPEIYPDLMESTGFIVGMFPVTVTKSKTGETYTYFDYLQKHQKLAFYEYPMDWLNSLREKLSSDEQPKPDHKPDSKHLTKKEYDVVKAILGKMECSVDKKTNVITIVVEDQDPQIAATVADSVQMHLQRTITDYRTKKARVDLEYMQKLFDEAHKEYSKARQKYAAFGDSYQNLKMQSYVLKGDELENEMQLKYTIYQQVVEQLQLAKAKVQERTPAFTIVQEASVPVKHSSRPKIVTLIIWMILGFLLRMCILFWRHRQSLTSI
jgi:uncharacterized protein involved in exopolysaccharide biosynthesis